MQIIKNLGCDGHVRFFFSLLVVLQFLLFALEFVLRLLREVSQFLHRFWAQRVRRLRLLQIPSNSVCAHDHFI